MLSIRIDTEDQRLWVSMTGTDGLENCDCVSLQDLAQALKPYLETKQDDSSVKTCLNYEAVNEISRLKLQLDEAQQTLQHETDDWTVITETLIEAQKDLENQLAEMTAKYNDICTIDRVDLLKLQLNESISKIERYKLNIDTHEQIRQKTAKECLEIISSTKSKHN